MTADNKPNYKPRTPGDNCRSYWKSSVFFRPNVYLQVTPCPVLCCKTVEQSTLMKTVYGPQALFQIALVASKLDRENNKVSLDYVTGRDFCPCVSEKHACALLE